jgi:hypothetical protein
MAVLARWSRMSKRSYGLLAATLLADMAATAFDPTERWWTHLPAGRSGGSSNHPIFAPAWLVSRNDDKWDLALRYCDHPLHQGCEWKFQRLIAVIKRHATPEFKCGERHDQRQPTGTDWQRAASGQP